MFLLCPIEISILLSVPGDGTVSLVIPRESGGYIIGYNKTLAHYDLTTAKQNTMLEVEHKKDNRFNDGKCDRAGRLYAGKSGHLVGGGVGWEGRGGWVTYELE